MPLLDEGMDSCRNFEHLLEAVLQQCIVLPLMQFIHKVLEDHFTSIGSLGQLERAVENAKSKTPVELGIRVSSTP